MSVESVSFRTKARTVDHLGREQIADCPTAVSELWKNAYDAYAKSVHLHIFDSYPVSAAILDDGIGMSYDDFISRWLVVGTESKLTSSSPSSTDRPKGMEKRPKQGRKGIGRLSCANLAPILLLVSKTVDDEYVAGLVDWRLFENPFFDLDEISIPVVKFAVKEDLPGLLNEMKNTILGNFGSLAKPSEKHLEEDRKRIIAWEEFDKLKLGTSSTEIIASIKSIEFPEFQLSKWDVWERETNSGTALILFDVTYDLDVLASKKKDDAALGSNEKFFETLSSFVDPFSISDSPQSAPIDFEYGAYAWSDKTRRTIVGPGRRITRNDTDEMEHVLEGRIDSHGVFKGRVKAFGRLREESYVIAPPEALTIPKGPTTSVGPVQIYLTAFENERASSTHDDQAHSRLIDLSKLYSGLLVFRDGLRVMPYGRTDNDFFEIDDRRSRNAGREFWNNRRMFGRLSISQQLNPNLRDKAGREGILDNHAAKALKAIIANVLMKSARDYFGSASEIRQKELPQIKDANRKDAAKAARNKLRAKNRKAFKRRLKSAVSALPDILEEIEDQIPKNQIETISQLNSLQDVRTETQEALNDYAVPGAPKKLGTDAKRYESYKLLYAELRKVDQEIAEHIDDAIQRLDPPDPSSVIQAQVARIATQQNHRIREWKGEIDGLLKQEFARFNELVSSRRKAVYEAAKPFVMRLESGELSFQEAMETLETIGEKVANDNLGIFPPYRNALESLADGIDLDLLATTQSDEVDSLQSDLERITSLAQLGIAVEIVGHELDAYDDMIGSGLNRLPDAIKNTSAVEDIRLGFEGLTDQLRFLSPLKLSGNRIQKTITGNDIANYIEAFFEVPLKSRKIEFDVTDEFRSFSIFEQPSRIYPVFINLMNNSLYWIGMVDRPEAIRLNIVDKEVVLSDSGPGVEAGTEEDLFSLYYTTRVKGGRGVGLYLCRANLAAGGHTIRYLKKRDNGLPGAHFAIRFKGAEF